MPLGIGPISSLPISALPGAPASPTPFTPSSYPATATGSVFSTSEQQAFVGPPFVFYDYSRTHPDAVFQDRVVRPSLPVHEHQCFAANYVPIPNPFVPATQPLTSFPERVLRPTLAVSEQLAVTEIYPKPEERLPLEWQPVYPDRAVRLSLHADEHLAWATSPRPETKIPFPSETYPHAVTRPFYPITEQDPFELPPLVSTGPITSPLDLIGCIGWWRADLGVTTSGGLVTEWDDQSGYGDVNRNFVQATPAKQFTFVAADPLLGRRPSLVDTGLATAVMSGAANLATPFPQPITYYWVGYQTGGHQLVGGLNDPPTTQGHFFGGHFGGWYIQDSLTGSLDSGVSSNFPAVAAGILDEPNNEIYAIDGGTAKASGAMFANEVQQRLVLGGTIISGTETPDFVGGIGEIIAFAGHHNATTRKRVFDYLTLRYFGYPTDALFHPIDPDRADRPSFPVTAQMAFVGTFPIVAAIVPNQQSVTFPDTIIPRPALHVSQQLATTELSPVPIPNVFDPATLPKAFFPERVIRPTLATAEHLTCVGSPRPEIPVSFPSETYPATVTRPAFPVTEQDAFELPPYLTTGPITSPKDLVGCLYWYRADLGISTSGGLVTEWDDQSGYGDLNKNLLQANPSIQFTYNTADPKFGNRPSLSCASNAMLTAPGNLASPLQEPITYYWVHYQTGGHYVGGGLYDPPTTKAQLFGCAFGGEYIQLSGSGAMQDSSTGPLPLPPTIAAGILDNPNNEIYTHDGEIPKNSGNLFVSEVQQRIAIGGVITAGVETPDFIGGIAEVIAFAGHHDATTRKRVFDYLSLRYFGYPTDVLFHPMDPDRVDRPSFPVSDQMAFVGTFPIAAPATPNQQSVVFPDTVSRPSLHASQQLDSAEGFFRPERTAPIAVAVYPDALPYPYFRTTEQLDSTDEIPQPERTAALASSIHPDRVERPSLGTHEQLAVTEVYPRPEDRVQLDWAPGYPDRVVRPVISVTEQQTLAFAPFPERRFPLASEVHPDRVERPFFGVVQQLASSEETPKPERTAPLAATIYPDRVERPSLGVTNHLAVTEVSPAPEDRADLDWAPVYPDRVVRPTFPPVEQLFFAANVRPEEKVQLDWEPVYPDRLDRPSLATSQQLAISEVSPAPEDRIDLDWTPIYPERAVRPLYSATEQPYFAYWPFPIAVAALTQINTGFTVAPDRIERPALAAADQLAVTEIGPRPERTTAIAVSVHPDRVERPSQGTHEQLAITEIAPAPERTQALASETHPDKVERPFLGVVEQLAVTELSPRPERTASLAVAVFPDSVARPYLLVSEQLATSEETPKPEDRIDLDWAPVYPDRIVRPSIPVFEQAFFVSIQQPEDRIDLDWAPIYPDRALHSSLAATEQLAFVGSSTPERTIAPAFVIFPDRIDRPALLTSNQLAAADFAPRPEERIQLEWAPTYPDRVLRAVLPVSEYLYFAYWPFPISTAALTQLNTGFAIFPDRVERPFLGTYEQLDSTDETPQPERSSALAVTVHPDRVERPSLGVVEQLATTEIAPRPERTAALAATIFPDTVSRPSLAAFEQLAVTEISPRPERVASLAVTIYPDSVARPALHVSEQLAVSGIEPQPEDRADLDWAPIYPDRALRAVLPISDLPFFVTNVQPEDRADLDWAPVYPDRVLRPALLVTEQLPYTTSAAPERTSSLAGGIPTFPDRVERPSLAVAEQLASTEVSPRPEDRIDLDWGPRYPDHVIRPELSTADQQAFGFYPFPIPTAALAQLSTGFTIFPDTVFKPSLGAASQLAVTEETPKPERTSSLAAVGFPDTVVRPALPVYEQLAVTEETPKPERKSPLASEVHSDAVSRPFFQVTEQLAVTEVSPRPERSDALAVAVFPDTVSRPFLAVTEQQASITPSPQPERTKAIAVAIYPDSVSRPFLLTSQQLDSTDETPKPEIKSTFFGAIFQDRVVRPALPVSEQLAVTELSPKPIPAITPVDLTRYPDAVARPSLNVTEQQAFVTSAQPERTRPIAAEVHADRVVRPTFPVTEQLAVTEIAPRPEHKSPLDWAPSFPERALRPSLPISLHLAFALAPQPERSDVLAVIVHPDRVIRPTYPTTEQLAFTTSPRPEHKIDLDWTPVYPDRAVRPFFAVPEQLAFVTSSRSERTDALAAVEFPERARYPWLPIDEYPAFTTSALPEEPLDWTPVYPDRIVRPAILTGDQQALALWPFPIATPPIPSESYSDRVVRPFLSVTEQLASTEIPSQPDRTAPLACVVFPDRVERAYLPIAHFPTTVGNPKPVSGPVPLSFSTTIHTTLRLILDVSPERVPADPEANNGPIAVPELLGDGFEYILVLQQPLIGPLAPASKPFGTPYQVIEQQLALRSIRADIQRYADGSTIYRVARRDLWKLKSDKIGHFVEQNAKTRFRIYPGDPTIGRTPLTIWLPVL